MVESLSVARIDFMADASARVGPVVLDRLLIGPSLTASQATRPHLLFVHGAWHGAWCFEKLSVILSADGWSNEALDLPSVARSGPGDDPYPGMYDDARAINERLERVDGPAVVVAHSAGGAQATEAVAAASNVVHVIYLAAFMIDAGETVASASNIPHEPNPQGLVPPPPPEAARRLFFGHLPDEEAEHAARLLAPQAKRSFQEPVTTAAWRTVPNSYIVCEQDESPLSTSAQEKFAQRSEAVYGLASDHSPFLSMPDELATLLTKISRDAMDR